MYIYLLQRVYWVDGTPKETQDLDTQAKYDANMAFVIVAEDEKEARIIAANNCGDEGHNIWHNPLLVSCERIGKPIYTPYLGYVVMNSFNAA